MATIDKHASIQESTSTADYPQICDPEGFPWLENGERMDQRTFHERYSKMPHGFRAELIEGTVYVMPSPLGLRHGRNDAQLSGCLFLYSAATPGTISQNNTTTILGESSEPEPDSALLVLSEYGGQTRDGEDPENFTFGAPELLLGVAFSSRSIDLHQKMRDYERAGVLEYLVYDLRQRILLGHTRQGDSFQHQPADTDGVLRSRVFPGLWLDTIALATCDRPRLVASLQRGIATPEHEAFVATLEQQRLTRAKNP